MQRAARFGGIIVVLILALWALLGLRSTPAGASMGDAVLGLFRTIGSGIGAVARTFGSTGVAGHADTAALIALGITLGLVLLLHWNPLLALAIGGIIGLLLYNPTLTANIPTGTSSVSSVSGTECAQLLRAERLANTPARHSTDQATANAAEADYQKARAERLNAGC